MSFYIDLKTSWICHHMAPALDAALSKMTTIPSGHICSIYEVDEKQKYVHFNVHLKPVDDFDLSRANIHSNDSTFFGIPDKMHASFFDGSEDDDSIPTPDLTTCSVDLYNDSPGNFSKLITKFRISFEFDSKCHFTLVLHLDSKTILKTDLQHHEFTFSLVEKTQGVSSAGYLFKIRKTEQISFGAPEEPTVCYRLVGADLQKIELSVITITDKRTYFREIFIRNLSGVAQEETMKYIRFGNYIFQVDLADFYIYGIVAVVAVEEPMQWPWTDNTGQLIQPPYNNDDVVKYKDLFEGCSAYTNARFALAFTFGDFRNPKLNSDSKRESQALLALLYSEPVRNFQTLEYNKKITEHIEDLKTFLNDKFLYSVHPMAWPGTFKDKKITLTGNQKVKQNWIKCQKKLLFWRLLGYVLDVNLRRPMITYYDRSALSPTNIILRIIILGVMQHLSS